MSAATVSVAMAYAILRVSKVKMTGPHGLAAVAGHIARTRPTPNADPRRGVRALVGLDPQADVMAVLPEKRRRDATVAMEFVLTASPEYFRPNDPGAAGIWDKAQLKAWMNLNLAWLKRRYGRNLAHVSLHLDESTPHVQALVVPLDSRGHLNARDLFGPQQLRALQTEYAEAMAPLGLRRGIEGSKARHEPIKKYYARVNRELSEVTPVLAISGSPPPVPEPTVADRLSPQAYAERAARRAYDAGFREGAKAQASALRPALAKAREFDSIKRRLGEREARLDELRRRADLLRDIPLREILVALGCAPDPKDPKFNWRTPAGRISTSRENPAQWYNHDQSVGGGGAIDLVMHLNGWDFKAAVAWLAARFGAETAVSSARVHAARLAETEAQLAAKLPAPSPLPKPCPEAQRAIRDYLVRGRGLPEELVKIALDRGAVFAARYGKYINAAFKLAAPDDLDGEAVGVELRGIGDKAFHGVRGAKGLFRVGRGECRELVVCESAIEALSYYALHGKPGLWAVGTAGDSGAGVELAQRLAANGAEVIAAQNADDAGNRQARRLIKAVPSAVRHRPQEANDWNDLLRIRTAGNLIEPAATVQARAAKEPDNPRFIKIQDRWVWAHAPDKTAITDHRDFLTVNDPEPEAIRYALALAAARWEKLHVRGSVEFRRAAWREAVTLGIEVSGYTPTTEERAWAEQQRAQLPTEPVIPDQTDTLERGTASARSPQP